jgi:GTP cyclohydrolase II
MRAINSKADGESPKPGSTLNGDAAALAVDRAVGEFRRGRAIATDSADGVLVVAPVETIGGPLLKRLVAASPAVRLLLTAERARAAGVAPAATGPIAVRIGAAAQPDQLKALAGMAGATRMPGDADWASWAGGEAPLLAAFGLAKAARLVPALIGFAADADADAGAGAGAGADPSLHRVPLAALIEHATATTSGIQLISESRVPLAGSVDSRVALFRDEYGGSEHVAVIIGAPDLTASVPVRLHSACLTGDLLGSLRCDCGEQLRTAVERIAALGGGVLLYLDQEGRSIGLANKLRAYQIQDTGVDTFDADHHLGFTADERSYDVAVAMLQQIGVSRVKLLTNNPKKIAALAEHGIDVEDRLPLIAAANEHNEAYLRSKRERAGHLGE